MEDRKIKVPETSIDEWLFFNENIEQQSIAVRYLGRYVNGATVLKKNDARLIQNAEAMRDVLVSLVELVQKNGEDQEFHLHSDELLLGIYSNARAIIEDLGAEI